MPRSLLLGLAVLAAAGASAQPRHLETLEGALSGAAAVGESYDGLWAAEPGVAAHVASEFYGGRAHVALHAFPNTPQAPELPEFLGLRGEVGWGARLSLPARLRLTAGGTVGAVHMRFDDEDLAGNALRNETELTTGLFARLDAPVAGPIRAFVGADLLHVYTAEPIVYRFVQGGLALTIPAPEWLQAFLR